MKKLLLLGLALSLSACYQGEERINCQFKDFSDSEILTCYKSVKLSALTLKASEQDKFFKTMSHEMANERASDIYHNKQALLKFQSKFNGLTATQVLHKYPLSEK